MGMIGTGVILAFITITYLIFALKVKPESFGLKLPSFLKFKKHADNQNVVHAEELLIRFRIRFLYPRSKASDKVHEDHKVDFVVRTTNQYLDDDDLDEEIPEILGSGSIIRDFDND